MAGSRAAHRALEVEGRRVAAYETGCFETRALDLYPAHHDRRFPRVKVRVRTYEGTGTMQMEVKQPQPGASPLGDLLGRMGLEPFGFSKYCLGIAALCNGARTERFRSLVRRFRGIEESHGDATRA